MLSLLFLHSQPIRKIVEYRKKEIKTRYSLPPVTVALAPQALIFAKSHSYHHNYVVEGCFDRPNFRIYLPLRRKLGQILLRKSFCQAISEVLQRNPLL